MKIMLRERILKKLKWVVTFRYKCKKNIYTFLFESYCFHGYIKAI